MEVTIGITYYNAQDTISRCLESAISVCGVNDEILIVDDHSSVFAWEKLLDIVGSVSDRYDFDSARIRLIRHDCNKGVAAARNTIIAKALGEYLAYLDDDDICHKDRLKQQKSRLLSAEIDCRTKDILCFGDRETIDASGQKGYVESMGNKGKPIGGTNGVNFILYGERLEGYYYGRFGTCTLFCRVDTLNKIGGFDESYRRCAECDLSVKLLLSGGYMVGVPNPIITQYITTGAIGEKDYKAEKKYYKKLLDDRRSYLNEKNKYFYALFRHYRRIAKAHGRFLPYFWYFSLSLLFQPSRIIKRVLKLIK